MPIRNSTTMLLTEDAAGALRADADLSAAFNNALLRVAGATPGVFGLQQRAAWTEAIRKNVGAFWGTAGGAAVGFTQATMDTAVGEDDGLPASVTEDVLNASSGQIGPIDVAGYYLLGIELQVQSFGSTATSVGGTQAPGGTLQAAIRTTSPLQGVSSLRIISSTVTTGPGTPGPAQPTPVPAFNKYPWMYTGKLTVTIPWLLGRGSLVEFGFRQSTASGSVLAGPSSDVVSAKIPNHGFWICLARALTP